MNLFFTISSLFFIGSVLGWVMELIYRRFISEDNPERKWINPGFCKGPYLPMYGCGLCVLYFFTNFESLNILNNVYWNRIIFLFVMILSMTIIEYIGGIVSLKIFKVRLWDYRNNWGNIQGIICPKYTLIWATLVIVYFFIHNYILCLLKLLSANFVFKLVMGLFFVIFIIDIIYSAWMRIYKRKKPSSDADSLID